MCATTFRASGSARVARDRVEVSSYFAVHTDVGLDHWGRYRDVLIPVDGRWLFASPQDQRRRLLTPTA